MVTLGNCFVDSEVYLIIFSSMVVEGSLSPPSGVILMPNENKEYLHPLRLPNLHPFRLLPRSVMPLLAFHILLDPGFLILDPLIILLVIRIFFSLTITSPLPIITLASGSQTMAKGIGSTCPLPSIPLTSVLYVPYYPFNLISISKLTRGLNC